MVSARARLCALRSDQILVRSHVCRATLRYYYRIRPIAIGVYFSRGNEFRKKDTKGEDLQCDEGREFGQEFVMALVHLVPAQAFLTLYTIAYHNHIYEVQDVEFNTHVDRLCGTSIIGSGSKSAKAGHAAFRCPHKQRPVNADQSHASSVRQI